MEAVEKPAVDVGELVGILSGIQILEGAARAWLQANYPNIICR